MSAAVSGGREHGGALHFGIEGFQDRTEASSSSPKRDRVRRDLHFTFRSYYLVVDWRFYMVSMLVHFNLEPRKPLLGSLGEFFKHG